MSCSARHGIHQEDQTFNKIGFSLFKSKFVNSSCPKRFGNENSGTFFPTRGLESFEVSLLREKNKLPPFKRLIAIIISSKDRSLSLQGAREIKVQLNQINDLEVLGPVDSPLLKIKKNFRSRLLIKFDNQIFMQKKITKVLNGLKISKKIKLMVDVDPINFA